MYLQENQGSARSAAAKIHDDDDQNIANGAPVSVGYGTGAPMAEEADKDTRTRDLQHAAGFDGMLPMHAAPLPLFGRSKKR